MFQAWQQGWDPYAASTPSLFKWNPSRFYAESLPVGNDGVGGPPAPGTIPFRSFMTDWWAPFALLALVAWALQRGALRGGFKLSSPRLDASGGVGK